jgi:hypothetical protein
MKHLLSCALFICFIVIFSCTQKEEEKIDKDQIAKEVISRYEGFVALLKSGTTEGVENFYSDDNGFYWVEDGQIQYPNKTALLASMDVLFDQVKSMDMRLIGKRVEVFNNNTAMLYVEYEQDMVLTSGFEFSINGAMTAQMQKEKGVWRFLIGHSSTKKERGG